MDIASQILYYTIYYHNKKSYKIYNFIRIIISIKKFLTRPYRLDGDAYINTTNKQSIIEITTTSVHSNQRRWKQETLFSRHYAVVH